MSISCAINEARDTDKRIIITYDCHEQAELAIVVTLAMESTNMFCVQKRVRKELGRNE